MFRLILLFSVSLSACAPTVVTQFNGDSIRVQSTSGMPDVTVRNEARRVCAATGKRAEYASTLNQGGSAFLFSHLYLCLPGGTQYQSAPRRSYLDSTSNL